MTPVFAPALVSLGDLVPHDGVLTIDELEVLARAIADRPGLWQSLVRADPAQRRYELVYEDRRLDVWVLSWMPGQATGFHDHYVSGVGLCVAAGSVVEDQMVVDGEHVVRRLARGATRKGGAGYIHRVRHDAGVPAVTIHAYSPRLDEVGQYRLDAEGVVRREPAPGRVELTTQPSARGTGVLGSRF